MTYSHLIVDVETVPDGNLIAAAKYPELDLKPAEAIDRFRGELRAKTGSDFVPHTFCLPAAVVVAGLGKDLELASISAIDAPRFEPACIAADFWRGYSLRNFPTLVTFNGKKFDLPLLEAAAFRYGIPIGDWWNRRGRWDKSAAHVDLLEELGNRGAATVSGGLNVLANMIGKPGKIGCDGSQVLGLWQAGRKQEIADYCTCDVLDTYFVFLRWSLISGRLSRDREQWLIENAYAWMKQREQTPGIKTYLDRWGGPS